MSILVLARRLFLAAPTKKFTATAAALCVLAALTPAQAATVTGVAVASTSGAGALDEVGLIADGVFLNDAIKYYIPLKDTNGVYGAPGTCGSSGFGTCSDKGNGGGILTMNLRFSGVSTSLPSSLSVIFEDLDLGGANDPVGFVERLKVMSYDAKANVNVDLTGWIKDIGGLVKGTKDTQQILSFDLGLLTTDPLFLVLEFKSRSDFYGTNTPEYLIATVTSPNPAQTPVPLPGALALFGTVLAGSWSVGRWRRRRAK